MKSTRTRSTSRTWISHPSCVWSSWWLLITWMFDEDMVSLVFRRPKACHLASHSFMTRLSSSLQWLTAQRHKAFEFHKDTTRSSGLAHSLGHDFMILGDRISLTWCKYFLLGCSNSYSTQTSVEDFLSHLSICNRSISVAELSKDDGRSKFPMIARLSDYHWRRALDHRRQNWTDRPPALIIWGTHSSLPGAT